MPVWSPQVRAYERLTPKDVFHLDRGADLQILARWVGQVPLPPDRTLTHANLEAGTCQFAPYSCTPTAARAPVPACESCTSIAMEAGRLLCPDSFCAVKPHSNIYLSMRVHFWVQGGGAWHEGMPHSPCSPPYGLDEGLGELLYVLDGWCPMR